MENPDTFHKEQRSGLLKQGNELDLLAIWSLIKENWYFFLIAIIISFFCARFYFRHTMSVYETSVTLLIYESDDRNVQGNIALLQGLGLPGGMRNLENQIMILKSRELVESTLRELPFEMEFYFKTIKNRLPIYPETPLRIIPNNEISLPKNTEFSITIIDNNSFTIEGEADRFQLKKTASFGEDIEIPTGGSIVVFRNEEWFNNNNDNLLYFKKKLYFIVYRSNTLINSFANRLNVEQLSREGSVLRISIKGTNREKDVDFLNKHVQGFQAISLNKKNSEADRRIEFIDDQLIGISDSLLMTENRLQQFRSSHRVMNLSAQGQAIIGQMTILENAKAQLELEANYYDYLSDYLSKDVTGEAPIIPITMGINDPGLTNLVNELAELQTQLASRGAGELNPLQRNLEQRVRITKNALRETLNGLRRANSLARSDNQQQINRTNAQASALPVTERQLLGIERKFQLNNELYTFLLETRAEQQMQKASNMADSEVIDSADVRFSKLVSPNQKKVYAIGIFSGILIAGLIAFFKSLFSKTIKEDDIKKITEVPIVGNIPHNSEKTSKIIIDYPGSTLAEAFRLLRSRMQFFTKETTAPVILVTSTMPNEGKTFTAINLASAYSLLGKKTVLVGFDLRKPRIFQDFNLSNERGVTTWLIGQDKLNDIIQETQYENLRLITAGPIPPNPSELIALEKTDEFIRLLKEQYDYIILDSSPIGFVSDTRHLAFLADTTILVVRPGITLREMLEITMNEINTSGIKGLCLVINDIKSDSKHYGYKEKYGYTTDKVNPKKHPVEKVGYTK